PLPEYSASARLVDVARSRKSQCRRRKATCTPGRCTGEPIYPSFPFALDVTAHGRTHSQDAHPRLQPGTAQAHYRYRQHRCDGDWVMDNLVADAFLYVGLSLCFLLPLCALALDLRTRGTLGFEARRGRRYRLSLDAAVDKMNRRGLETDMTEHAVYEV